ncbi:hypothetical protein PLEOSDRAFT_1083710 [Pleurotus ostreatus PC15]|uniref:FIT family protein scs3 n=1 Tax=Pleurotus ostreatus (strain PC15) TaxID=1137138 RepID=A0A067NKX0_PLEO1|nr:hypothetical protein PLEOSDRAFT_1083710 [Pleurotus ostreatus PC15]
MPDLQVIAFASVTGLLFIGTASSVLQETFLDTSNPLLANLPHPLHTTHYFANKSNFLNVIFIKRAWGWTSAVFLFSYLSSPRNIRTANRFAKWAIETLVWMVFTSWFFGPALFERVLVASGGECMVSLPSGDHVTVPHDLCYSKRTVTVESHPQLFSSVSLLPDAGWSGRPRLRKGHDVSGHVFLLTMSVLFLTNQLRLSLRTDSRTWPALHYFAVGANVALIGIWLFAIWTTALYFHSPLEKVSGYFLGLAGYAASRIF